MTQRPDVVDFTTLEGSTVIPPEKVPAAALTACRCAHDIEDARLLLDALGLADGDHLATLRTVRPMWPWTQAAIARGQA